MHLSSSGEVVLQILFQRERIHARKSVIFRGSLYLIVHFPGKTFSCEERIMPTAPNKRRTTVNAKAKKKQTTLITVKNMVIAFGVVLFFYYVFTWLFGGGSPVLPSAGANRVERGTAVPNSAVSIIITFLFIAYCIKKSRGTT